MDVLPLAVVVFLTFISPFLTAIFNRVGWSKEVKTLVAMGVALVISVLYLFLTNSIQDWTQIAVVFPAVFGLQTLVFRFLFNDLTTKIEAATTPGTIIITPGSLPEVKPVEAVAPVVVGSGSDDVKPGDPVVVTGGVEKVEAGPVVG